ncbi:protein MpTPS-like2 [Marchantia polymorpha subsp. ruderalis]|uniref:Uncharacterized protein n=1 Tax=Marchantia polymorpha TaxID=3197 RepID=A0A2R6X881_MARPO|nr:hypothetical protein MARPO_0030s0059 [Marchantia polymorpha]BBN20196.1 hypothetical protein Mp_8g17250 [Marchantia polymorpha subsp. ruderalis]|eukprot:PTQ42314.1 hypothetical protein MARPO_0030s0059 [Marchantia polymorpha]
MIFAYFSRGPGRDLEDEALVARGLDLDHLCKRAESYFLTYALSLPSLLQCCSLSAAALASCSQFVAPFHSPTCLLVSLSLSLSLPFLKHSLFCPFRVHW